MSIVSSASLQVCWKGELLDAFSPSQGLCQGDSLSPYLFVLCMKTLHFKINWVILWKEWCPLKLSREVDLYPTFFLLMTFFFLEELCSLKLNLWNMFWMSFTKSRDNLWVAQILYLVLQKYAFLPSGLYLFQSWCATYHLPWLLSGSSYYPWSC